MQASPHSSGLGLSALAAEPSCQPAWIPPGDATPAAHLPDAEVRSATTALESWYAKARPLNPAGLLRALWDVLREHALLLALGLAYFAIGHFAVPHVSMSGALSMLSVERVLVVVGASWLTVTFIVERLRLAGSGEPAELSEAWRQAYGNLRSSTLNVRCIGGFVLGVAGYGLFMIGFARYKAAIPDVHPFAFDELFLRVDRALHFGIDPWQLLHPVLGYPIVTVVLDRLYFVWYFVGVGVLIWQIWSRNRALRAQFLLTLIGCWVVLGTFFATLFSSVGPCYFEALTGNAEPYAPLMHYLAAVSAQYGLYAVSLQDALWTSYEGRGGMPFVGIAAMPSLHVALAVLWTLLAWRVDRRLGAVFAAFAFLTMLGSVHLGWHYAIDGYFSIALVPLLWWGAGRLTAWYGGRTGAFR